MQEKASARSRKVESRAYPDKLFYKIGEVSRIAGVEPYVLRYWESEFSFLRPRKSKTGQRIYVRKDLDLIFRIKELLYEERYTIEGVRKRLAEGAQATDAAARGNAEKTLSKDQAIEHVKRRLREILTDIS
ncbi:MAG: MerR family transcriptional regulator [Thermodesulfovibrionales bacterium]